jgi:hypothetical protein
MSLSNEVAGLIKGRTSGKQTSGRTRKVGLQACSGFMILVSLPWKTEKNDALRQQVAGCERHSWLRFTNKRGHFSTESEMETDDLGEVRRSQGKGETGDSRHT